MPINTNVNNNSAVVVVGRTAPVPTGQQSAAKSIPVVVASDQEAIPVEEQNKQQSEVALSLLGIPRAEVALGIFADVNTYDVNPSEWSAEPIQLKTILAEDRADYLGFQGQQDWGLSHVPAEAGALIEAPATEYAVLTSKRFFRYQPGRVSAGTFGVKFGRAPITTLLSTSDFPAGNGTTYMMSGQNNQVRHPSIKKYGVFDNFDGYYYESINESRGDNFCCVRRSQSLIKQKSQYFFYNPTDANNVKQFGAAQYEDYGNFELPGIYYKYHGDAVILRDGLVNIHAGLFDPSLLKEKRNIDIATINGNASGGEIILDTVEREMSNFVYNNVTGRATVTTVGDHGFQNGDSITLKDILLSCNTGEKLYPNKYSRKFFTVKGVSGQTITVYVGKSDYDGVATPGETPAFTSTSAFSSGTVAQVAYTFATANQSISKIERVDGGQLEITTGQNHDMIEGDLVEFKDVTWNSGTWPDASDNDHQKIFKVRRVKNNRIFVIAIGDANFSGLTDASTYTSGGTYRHITAVTNTNGVDDISSGTFVPGSGIMTIDFGTSASGFSIGDDIELSSIQTSCSYNVPNSEGSHTAANPFKVYPAKDDEDTFPISNVTSNTFTFELFKSTIVHTYQGGGRVTNLGLRKGSSIYYNKNGQTTNGVDGGIYFVDEIIGPKIKLTVNPTNGDTPTSVYNTNTLTPVEFGPSSNPVQYKLTPTDATYNPTTGIMSVTATNSGGSTHGLVTGDLIRFSDYSLGFTCDLDGNTATKYYPRPINPTPASGLSSFDPLQGKFVAVTVTGTTTFEVQVLAAAPSSNEDTHDFVYGSANSITVEKVRPYLITPAPFILPDTAENQYSGSYSTSEPDDFSKWVKNVFGAFPYMYTFGDTTIGYIKTDIAASTEDGANALRADIDYVNNKLLKDWIYNHVKPQYWPVYEYRVPRSRFSGEKINGQEDEDVTYSDVVFSSGSQKFPGEAVKDLATGGGNLTRSSNWNLNPENVTMYKIEFSWYGAVGALFLAYVPLDSGEARWVRVHHLRASNQLKVSALGNPTLPITYMVYGGGTEFCYGYFNSSKQQNYIDGSSSRSEFIVKYGASYYIDGGDRGTVRLFNYATPAPEPIHGSKLTFNISSGDDFTAQPPTSGDFAGVPYIDISGATVAGTNNLVVNDFTFYMNATVLTPNRDPGVKVIWVDTANEKLYINRVLSGGGGGGDYSLIVDRPKVLIGLKCREEVNSVRNRIQVYPTRLSIGNSGSFATVKLVKSPVFQTEDVVSGDFETSYNQGSALNIGSIGKPTALNSTNVNNLAYLNELGSTFGYFRGFYDGSTQIITVFGKLQKDASGIYLFSAYEKTNVNLLIFGDFLRAGEFYEPNPSPGIAIPGTYEPTDTPLAALSAISISTEQRTPIPGTGQQITTLYTPSNSGEQFELQQFFDYNKDYLSFPLTDEIETLFILGSETNTYNNTSAATTITAAITWEEQ
mgnify:CR=1 FL=1